MLRVLRPLRQACWLMLLFTASAAQAIEPASWTLGLSWAPGFCATHASKQQCQLLNQTDNPDMRFAQSSLTIHGLWPQQQYCAAPELKSSELPSQLPRYMPGVYDDLAEHEWSKHGSCTGLSAPAYFQLMIKLSQQVASSVFGHYLTLHAGSRVPLSELRQAAGVSWREGMRFVCSHNRLVQVEWSVLPAPLLRPEPDFEQAITSMPRRDRCGEEVQL